MGEVIIPLDNVVKGPEFQGSHRRRLIALAGDDDKRGQQAKVLCLSQEIKRSHFRHPQVHQDKIKLVFLQKCQCVTWGVNDFQYEMSRGARKMFQREVDVCLMVFHVEDTTLSTLCPLPPSLLCATLSHCVP